MAKKLRDSAPCQRLHVSAALPEAKRMLSGFGKLVALGPAGIIIDINLMIGGNEDEKMKNNND